MADAGFEARAFGPFSAPVAGVYNATLPTLTDGDHHEVPLDSKGRLLTAVGSDTSATGTAVDTVNKPTLAADSDAAVAATAGLRYMGFTAKETTGTGYASFNVVKGATGAGGGTPLDYVTLSPGETAREWYGPEGMDSPTGISIDWISGTPSVTIRSKVVS